MVVEVRDVYVTDRGLELRFQPDDHQIRYRVEREGQWEEPVAKAIDKFLRPGWTMLDLGAHVGYFTTIAASFGNQVIAVEPRKDAYDLLVENVERNGFAERVETHRVAVTDSRDKFGYMAIDPEKDGAPGTAHLAAEGELVPLWSLRGVLRDRRPEFIKADIEGMEYRVFRDSPEVLDAAEVVVFEVGLECRRYGNEPRDVVELLEEHGFTVSYMNGVPLEDGWDQRLAEVPDGYMNLLAQRHPKEAVRGTAILCAWRDMKIETAESLLALRDAGWGYAVMRGDALISRSRSRAVSNWYRNTDEDAFLMIDDDVVFTVEHCEKVLGLAREKRSIAVGAYVVKDGGHLACRRFIGQEITFGPRSEPVEIEYPATGFMAVHRDVIDAMVEAKHPDGSPVFPYCDAFGLSPMWPFFDTFCIKWNEGTPEERYEYLSEDYAFGEQARRLGFQVWLDPSVILYHLGTYPYNVHEMKGVKRLDGGRNGSA